ncbi:MAG TPA: hypothetical protein VGK70_05720, partial [Thermoanaerobaculia bacterium]
MKRTPKTKKRVAPLTLPLSPRRGRGKRTRESLDEREKRAAEVLRRLGREYPDARCALDYSSPLELLV